ncbi:ABC transporter permease, partial [Clostridioides difficile]
AKNVLNYTFPDLLNSTIWNNMTMFFPMIIALIGGYMINREYTDDTLKNLQVIPIAFPKLMIGKLSTIGLLSILLGLCNSFVTIIVGIIACRENMTLSTIIIGTIQICGMALFTFIGEMPLIAHCGKKQNSFKGGAVAAFLLGYISIYFKNPIIRNLYPLSAGLSIVGFNGEGFVTDTTGAYSSSQSILL